MVTARLRRADWTAILDIESASAYMLRNKAYDIRRKDL